MEIEPLLEPVSPELPCGPDPEDYESDKELYEAFSQLKARLDGEMKNGVKQPPRWPEVQKEALQLAARTKHLHLAVVLADCGLSLDGFSGFNDGLRLIRSWCENFWDHLYPLEVRHTLVDSLSYPRFLTKPRRITLAKGPGGAFSFEDYEKALEDGRSDDSAAANQARLVLGTFQTAPREQHAVILSVIEEALENVRAIEGIFEDRLPDEPANLMDLRDLLNRMAEALRPMASQPSPDAAEVAGVEAAASNSGGGQTFGGSINNREQAGEQLERIARYFEKNEPSSPLPYLLRRARRCIGMSFMDLVDELASDKNHAVQILKPDNASEENVND
jgi:type VI secretion system protein ImpA